MFRRTTVIGALVVLSCSLAAAGNAAAAPTKLSAAEIVQKNVSARGGLDAWRSVQSIKMTGTMEAGGNRRPTLAVPDVRPGKEMPAARPTQEAQLPFVLELKRPRKMRMELQFKGQTAIQVFDGTNGWKLRPFLNRHQVEPYTAEELKSTQMQSELDGPLVDCARKGTKVELEGIEKVQGNDAYKLKLTLKNGETQHVWIDAKTFLESKVEGTPRRMDGKYHPVSTYPKDYEQVNGVVVPHTLETSVEGYSQVETIHIDQVSINPKLDDTLFAKLK